MSIAFAPLALTLVSTTPAYTPTQADPDALRNATGCWAAPGQSFDLSSWKLMIPGPLEIYPTELASYAGPNFHSDPATGAMVFWLDSAAEGSSPNSHYVRSELRELYQGSEDINWSTAGHHALRANLAVPHTPQTPRKVTVLQIHGVGPDGGKAPPLLRVAMVDGNLRALVKNDNVGDTTESVPVVAGVRSRPFTAEIAVDDGVLTLRIDDAVAFQRDVSFWTWRNYFKAGDYAQATSGISEVRFYDLEVEHR